MEIRQTIDYLAARAHKLGRSIFRNEAGALTLEWIVIAVALVGAVAVGARLFKEAINAAANSIK